MILRYLRTYWLTVAFFTYLACTTVLKSITGTDFTMPCLIKYCTGHSCYGCGLTTAATHLVKLEIHQAYEANPLIFVVLPVLGLLMIRHWIEFKKEQKSLNPNHSSM